MGTKIYLQQPLKHPEEEADYVQTCLTGWPKQPMIHDNQAPETNVSITETILIFSQQTIFIWREYVYVKQISGF